MPAGKDDGKAIVIRDRRKPNQYTTDNVIAREWLPILRVGDAFFFYSVYLSMANRETESSWGSLRTMAEYLQCGIDLIIRGNKLLEICELLYVETGDHRKTNEYYILDPPPLTEELQERIHRRLDEIAQQETSKNWRSWVKQVRRAMDKHRSLTSIWAERRIKRGGRPVKTAHPQKSACDSQSGFLRPEATSEKGDREPQAGCLWDTTTLLVAHDQGACDSQPEQEQKTNDLNNTVQDQEISIFAVREQCDQLGVTPTVVDILLEKHSAEQIARQLEWLPFRQPRNPAAMLVSAVQEDWEVPASYTPSGNGQGEGTSEPRASADVAARDAHESAPGSIGPGDITAQQHVQENTFTLPGTRVDAREAWDRVLEELRMQMTRATFDTWLGGSHVVCVLDDVIVVQVRDKYAVEWLQARWHVPIQRTLRGIAGCPVDVDFRGPL